MEKKKRFQKPCVIHWGEPEKRRQIHIQIQTGQPQFVYSWKLVATDRLPKGKSGGLPLREKEAQIQKDLADGIDSRGKKMTLGELYEKQNASRANIKRSTEKKNFFHLSGQTETSGTGTLDGLTIYYLFTSFH